MLAIPQTIAFMNEVYLAGLIQKLALFDDRNAYKLLFEHFFPSLKRFAFSFIKNQELAEEIASDAMINIWRNRASLQEIKDLSTYLFIATRNIALNYLKQQNRLRVVNLEETELPRTLSPEEQLLHREQQTVVQQAIEALPFKCRMAFKLVKEEGLSYKQTAEILDISVKTVDAHLVAAMTKITRAVTAASY